jgi:catechol 2,3-dioxygenase-like lactoylglutathione lyase family enzyme
MARIRHLTIKAQDPVAVAEFYKRTFGMQELLRRKSAGGGDDLVVFLTDGYINFAILPAKSGREGVDHFGFEVEDVEATSRVALEAGAKESKAKPRDGRYAEGAICDPTGQSVDVSEAGAYDRFVERLPAPSPAASA